MSQRLYELAREMGLSSNDLLAVCQQQGMDIKNRLSSITEEQAQQIRNYLKEHGVPHGTSAPTVKGTAGRTPTAPPVRLAAPPPVRPVTAPPIHPRTGTRPALPPRPTPVRPVTRVTAPPVHPPSPEASPKAAEVPRKPLTKPTTGTPETEPVVEAPPATAAASAPPSMPVASVPQQAPPKGTEPVGSTTPAEPAPTAAQSAKYGVVKPAPARPPEQLRYGVVKPAPAKLPDQVQRVARKASTAAPPTRVPKRPKVIEPDVHVEPSGRKDRKAEALPEERVMRIHRTRRNRREPTLLEAEEGGRVRLHRGRRDLKTKPRQPVEQKPTEKAILDFPVTVREFSARTGIKADRVIKELLERHSMVATINRILPNELVEMLAIEFGIEVEIRKERSAEEELEAALARTEPVGEAVPRPPVVTLLGHVDHGKTTLLDAIRESNIVATEAGGITQHMRAFSVERGGRKVVFLDTPGHEAFTAMRARGAHVTDIAVLVVAADDGVMPQTDEAINHARAAGVPIVVAMNKIDKPEANIDRLKRQLAERDLLPEDWGGKTICVPVSALQRKGIDELIEMLALEAELLELKAHPQSPARGVVLEARIAEGRGVVATVLIQDGTLHKGDIILCGSGWGRARALFDDKGNELQQAGPATPVEVSGLSELPEAGEKFYVLNDIQKAREIAEERKRRERVEALAERQHVTLETLYQHIEAGKARELRIILKTDVQGTLEALRKAIEELSTQEVRLRILHAAAGGITESDVLLADASDAIIIGFHVVPEERARTLAEERKVEIRLYQIIYQVTDDIKAAIEGMLEPESREVITARLNVLKTFRVSKVGTVAGCAVAEGTLHRSDRIRVVRDNVVVFESTIESLKRLKDDIREAAAGTECGVKIANFDDVKEGDVLIGYRVQQIARRLSTVLSEEKQRRASEPNAPSTGKA